MSAAGASAHSDGIDHALESFADVSAVSVVSHSFPLMYASAAGGSADPDGIDDAFELVAEVNERVKTGVWVGDCFIYNTASWRLNYCVGGEVCVPCQHVDFSVVCVIGGQHACESRGGCFIYNTACWRFNFCMGGGVFVPPLSMWYSKAHVNPTALKAITPLCMCLTQCCLVQQGLHGCRYHCCPCVGTRLTSRAPWLSLWEPGWQQGAPVLSLGGKPDFGKTSPHPQVPAR
eukprot:scaffold30694_cov18-Tisochrysis_lutea.AAC.4